MNLKEIKDMINLMNENDLTEIEVEREGTKIKIKKAFDGVPGVITHGPGTYHVQAQPPAQLPAPAGAESAAVASNKLEIKSPMVGTFYRSPSPDSAPFIEVGHIVEVGQVVCIVEAMKLMNEIKSEVRGRVSEVPIENAQPVEFGQTLFVVEPV